MSASGGWNTIESDAGVFTYLIEKLGCRDVQFEELISLDEEMLEQLSPVLGVCFLFKIGTETRQTIKSGSANPATDTTGTDLDYKPVDGTYDYNAAEQIFFANQVINNACGTQALLSILLNKDATSPSPPTENEHAIDIGDNLRDFLSFTSAFPPLLRGETLSNSDLIRETHNSFSRSSVFSADSSMYPQPSADEDELYHFIAYTPIQGHLYELDGLAPAPINHGDCSFTEFPRKVLDVMRRRIGRYNESEIRFNVLACVRDRRVVCREIGDYEGLEREEAKRRDWAWEVNLRQHNFLSFAGEILKAVVAEKVKDGSYSQWVEDAVRETERRITVLRARKGGGDDDMEID